MKGSSLQENVNRELEHDNAKLREQYSRKVQTCMAAGIH